MSSQAVDEPQAVDDEPAVNESSSESDSDISVGPLESSESMGGAPLELSGGGYNVNRYYLNRLNQFDKLYLTDIL